MAPEKVEEVEAKVKTDSAKSSEGMTADQITQKVDDSADMIAVAAMIVGLFNLCSWCFPVCGVPIALLGIVLGVLGMKSEKNKSMAMAGLILSAVGLIASVVNIFLGFAINVF